MKEVLSGETVIEFPTFYICKSSELSKFRLLIAPFIEPEAEEPLAVLASDEDVDVEKELSPAKIIHEEKRQTAMKHGKHENILEDGEEEEEEEDEGEDEAEACLEKEQSAGYAQGYEDFMQELMDLQTKDIATLQSIIKQQEEDLLGHSSS